MFYYYRGDWGYLDYLVAIGIGIFPMQLTPAARALFWVVVDDALTLRYCIQRATVYFMTLLPQTLRLRLHPLLNTQGEWH